MLTERHKYLIEYAVNELKAQADELTALAVNATSLVSLQWELTDIKDALHSDPE